MPPRRVLLLEESRKKHRQMYTSKTRYKNKKNRPILRSVQIAYVVKVGPKTFYGLKAAQPLKLLSIAPMAIRPK
jgi:hypothetical protein